MQKTKKGTSEEVDIKNKRNVELYKSGDSGAVSRLYEDNYSFVKMQLKAKISGDDYLVEDLSQDVMMKMISNLDSYNISETKFRSWLSSICFSVFVDYYRSLKVRGGTSYLDFSSAGYEEKESGVVYNVVASNSCDGMREILRSESINLVRDAVNRISNLNQKRALKKFLEGKKYEEIASEMGENINTVKGYIFRAKETLRSSDCLADFC
jgi:RNA polymerase sigma-70 factor (ECF subfamily)